ncbi:MAG: DUF1684 domain-containing protein [Calditrichaeota bacterium]|nr:DUF1684 domain-containing protein [Calditrichota bacterium]
MQGRWRMIAIILFAGISLLLMTCGKKHQIDEIAYRQEIEEWHRQRIADLIRPDGWLTLVGLHWLKEGANPFGSDSSNAIVFPPKVPAFMGTFYLRNGLVTVKIRPGVSVYYQDQPVDSLELQHDLTGEPTILSHGTLQWYIIKRGDRYAVRIKDSESPVRIHFKGIERFPVDSRWRLRARFEPYQPPRTIDVPTVLGTTVSEPCPGRLVFEWEGKTYALDVIQEKPIDPLFILFGDQTNGQETYGGGRFLYADPPDASGFTVLDFNRAYNPPCAFTPYATCPLPPAQNQLPFAVRAGEKAYGDAHH